MKNIGTAPFSLLFLLVSLFGNAQSYDLQFTIKGVNDTVLLGHFVDGKPYRTAEAVADQNGSFRFTGEGSLSPGIYFIAVKNVRLLDLVVGDDQQFSIETDTVDLPGLIKVTGDIDNQLFYENMNFNIARNKEVEPFRKVLQDSTATDAARTAAREGFLKVNEKVIAYQNNLIAQHPNTVTAKYVRSLQPVKVPDPPVLADGRIDSTFQLRYYRQHFFDNVPLSDPVMLHLPASIYTDRIQEYLDELYAPDPDTLIQVIDRMATEAKKNEETYRAFVVTVLGKYGTPEYMGLDKVFVHVIKKYVSSGEMDYWIDDATKKSWEEFAHRYSLSLIGQKGKDLILQDANGVMRALYNMKNKYTIVYFFDPDCGTCKKETPKLVDFLNKTKFDVGVYAVSADTSMTKMKNYIQEMNMQKFTTVCHYYSAVGHYQQLYDAASTPTLYVLDQDKIIIGKKIPSENLEAFLTDYERVLANRARLNRPPH